MSLQNYFKIMQINVIVCKAYRPEGDVVVAQEFASLAEENERMNE